MSENSNEIEFEDLMNKGTSEFSYADIQWLKGYAHTFYLQLENIKKELMGQDKYIDDLKKEYDKALQQKENIIKEVREYIEEWQRFPHTNGSTHRELKNLIEILDKAGSEKE